MITKQEVLTSCEKVGFYLGYTSGLEGGTGLNFVCLKTSKILTRKCLRNITDNWKDCRQCEQEHIELFIIKLIGIE